MKTETWVFNSFTQALEAAEQQINDTAPYNTVVSILITPVPDETGYVVLTVVHNEGETCEICGYELNVMGEHVRAAHEKHGKS